MPKIHAVQGAQRNAKVGWRTAGVLRLAAVAAGAVGLTAGVGVLTASSALASSGLQPGNLTLQPASGAVSLTPKFATTDGCPTGYQGSAQVSMFEPNGTLISRISLVVPFPTAPIHGTLEGSIGAILKFAGIPAGGTSQWAVGCYTGQGGTGNVQWVQSTVVKLAADGKSYSLSPGSGQSQSGSGSGQAASSSATKQPTLQNLYGQVASAKYPNPAASSSGGSGSRLEAAAIAAACGVAVAGGGLAFYRRRQRKPGSVTSQAQ